MSTPLFFSAFVMNTASHILHGVWRQPDACQVEFNSLDLWVALAKELEAGLFDVIFFADVVGLYTDFKGSYRKHVETGLQIPSNDPSVILSALAYNTEDLGLAFTSNIMQEHPNATIPGSYTEFIAHVMPELQKRGLAKEGYTQGTLRRKLFGRDTVPDTHPAAAYRGAFR